MIRYEAHQQRKECAANDAHGDKRRGLVRMTAQVFQAEAENSGEHNDEEKVDRKLH